MKLLFRALGVLIMVAGVFLGIYLTVWWGWVGGIIAVIEAAKVTPIEAADLALGIVRIVFASMIGGLVGWIVVSLGALAAVFGDHF